MQRLLVQRLFVFRCKKQSLPTIEVCEGGSEREVQGLLLLLMRGSSWSADVNVSGGRCSC